MGYEFCSPLLCHFLLSPPLHYLHAINIRLSIKRSSAFDLNLGHDAFGAGFAKRKLGEVDPGIWTSGSYPTSCSMSLIV